MKKVFICYEENYGEVALDAGPVNELTVFKSEESARKWLKERILAGINEGYISENTEITPDIIHFALEKYNTFSVEMWYGEVENDDVSYAICIQQKEISD